MEATDALRAELRRKIGETVPEGGTVADTMFPDEAINLWLENASSMNDAALEGWEAKLAEFTNLVDVTDGAASRRMSQLMENAKTMVDLYRRKIAAGPTTSLARGRARIGKIVRHG